MKKEWQSRCVMYIRLYMKGRKLHCPIDIHYHFFEPNKKRDKGNILSFADKIFEDALQQAGTIPNDNWACINNISCEFDVDAKNPRIEIILTEV